MRPAGSPAELERRRLRAVELLAQGHPPVEVARMVGAALAVSPRRDRVRLYFRLHPQADISSDQVIAFLRYLHQELREPCLLVWDRLNAHRAKRTTQFVARLHHLHTFFLPAYAPELNPVEYAWSPPCKGWRLVLSMSFHRPRTIHFQ